MKRIILSLFLAALMTLPTVASAQDDPRTAQDALIDLVGKAIVEETTQRSEEVRKAKEILDEVLRTGTPEQQEEAQRDVDRAEEEYAEAQIKLDTARVDAFAEKCGKTAAEIQAMRDSGMGWGKIAKECGAHPSTAGKGKGKGKDKKKGKDKGKK